VARRLGNQRDREVFGLRCISSISSGECGLR
jgi:hypothetical protein